MLLLSLSYSSRPPSNNNGSSQNAPPCLPSCPTPVATPQAHRRVTFHPAFRQTVFPEAPPPAYSQTPDIHDVIETRRKTHAGPSSARSSRLHDRRSFILMRLQDCPARFLSTRSPSCGISMCLPRIQLPQPRSVPQLGRPLVVPSVRQSPSMREYFLPRTALGIVYLAGPTVPPSRDGYGYQTGTPMPISSYPFLHKGYTLVYPETYLCHGCRN